MKTKLQEIIKSILQQENIAYDKEILIEKPALKENGDFSTNIALQLTKILKENPMTIAEKLSAAIKDEVITKIEVKAPGFINFFVKKDYLIENINNVLNLNENYGKTNLGNNKKVNIEFVSANPTGILHMGNARGGAYGDNLAKILTFTGYDVTKEYYINDAGNQINNLALSIVGRYKELLGLEFEIPEDGYHGEIIKTIAQHLKETHQDTLLDRDLEFFKVYGIDFLMDKIKKVLLKYHVNFDTFTSERAIYQKDAIPKIIAKLKENNCTYEKEGALWFKTSEFGDNTDNVLIKQDGNYTYLVPDIAYHINKISRGYEKLYDVLGTDHHGYVGRLKASLKALGYNPAMLEVKLLQLVRLVEGKEEVKMSKRAGNGITLNDLIDELGVNVVRYFFASRSLDTQMDFDMELAKKTTSENPFYYIQYAYARISSILSNYDDIKPINNYETLNNEEVYKVLEAIDKFQEIVIDASNREMPHLIANYVYDLANIFHTFYEKYRIISKDEKTTNENLNLIKAIKITIKNALYLIGIEPAEKM